MEAFDVSFAEAVLSRLRTGSRVGVIVLQGALCPVTKAHILALTEARALLCGLPLQNPFVLSPSRKNPAAAVDACIAIVVLEDQRHVGQKLLRAGETDVALSLETRRDLVQLALRPYSDWATALPLNCDVFDVTDALRARFPALEFVRYELAGADEIAPTPHRLETAGAGGAADSARLVVFPRSHDPAHPDSRALLAALHGDVGRWPYVTVGPGLPDVSSGQARAALRAHNVVALSNVCPPEVASWLLTHAVGSSGSAPGSSISGSAGPKAAKPGGSESSHYSDL
jgi:hypothetical protein